MKQQPWRIFKKNGISWARDPAFHTTGQVLQGFCGRTGGVSQGSFESLNISYVSGDDPRHVAQNREKMADAIGFGMSGWTGLRQVHGSRVIRTGLEDAGRGAFGSEAELLEADGQITNIPGITLISQHADCVPLYFWDPAQRAIGLSHGGWKGTLLDIAGSTVKAMAEAYGSKPEDLLAAIGPSAGPCHYEVDGPVIHQVTEVFGQGTFLLDRLLQPSQNTGHAFLDLWETNRQLLLRQGLRDSNISISGLCTLCHQETFFSHRCGFGGRQAAFLQLL